MSGTPMKKTLSPKAAPPSGLFKPSYTQISTSRVVKEDSPAGVGKSEGSERWTPEMVLRNIRQAGPSGATFEVTKCISIFSLEPLSFKTYPEYDAYFSMKSLSV